MNDRSSGGGVDYSALDPVKIIGQKLGSDTNHHVSDAGMKVLEWTRGESVFVVELLDGNLCIGSLIEGVGTKPLVACSMEHIADTLGLSIADLCAGLGQDTLAMNANDMITLGIMPRVVNLGVAVGDASWLDPKIGRGRALLEGMKRGCDLAHCTWGGGETPELRGLINPDSVELVVSGWGTAEPHELFRGNIQDGDAMVAFSSSGVHANGYTDARTVGDRIGYDAELDDGRPYGLALLEPTHLYVRLVELCQKKRLGIRYGVNITGHGLRKLMRLNKSFSYEVEQLPQPDAVFRFLQEHLGYDDRTMYGAYNMGVGFVLYVNPDDVRAVLDIATWLAAQPNQPNIKAWELGWIRKSDTKRVVLGPANVIYADNELRVR